jgi:hypothetical protein
LHSCRQRAMMIRRDCRKARRVIIVSLPGGGLAEW